VDLDHPDYEQYPQARLLQPVDVVMGPGDIMMFPRCRATSATDRASHMLWQHRRTDGTRHLLHFTTDPGIRADPLLW